MKFIHHFFIMLLIFSVPLMAFPLSSTIISECSGFQQQQKAEGDSIIITILYDNYVFTEGTQADWGFSCLVENTEKTILFDTGTRPDILMKNATVMNKDFSQLDIIVISHNHGDHTGGLLDVLKKSDNMHVYLPYSTPDSYVNQVKNAGGKVFSAKESVQICRKCYLTGELGDNIKEQSLILDTKEGLVVIAGCSHPGIVNIVKRAQDILGKEIYLVFGGFHLRSHSGDMVADIIAELKSLGVQKCGPTHCTGDEAIQMFKKVFGNDFLQMGTGKVIKIAL
jgi:7,8-dihydropterin-6-yl-methyl-4-(beta-D-ribofuranosyl)aminobenzene 5'-phosphate synthase